MKKVLFFLLFFSNAYLAIGQRSMTTKEFAIGERRRGYVGILGGYSFPLGDFTVERLGRAKEGIRTDITFGYLFTENVGVAAKAYYGTHDYKEHPTRAERTNWKYYGLLAGPLISGTIARNTELAFHPMVGFSQANFPREEEDKNLQSKVAFAAGLGANLQYNFHSRFGAHFSLDYYYSRVKFDRDKRKYMVSTVTPSLGITYRFH